MATLVVVTKTTVPQDPFAVVATSSTDFMATLVVVTKTTVIEAKNVVQET